MGSSHRSAESRPRGRDSASLVKHIANGDESAFATLYDTTCELIYGLLLRVFDNSAMAEQVLVDVYKAVWEQAATYDEHEKPLTWLITMARSNAITRLRVDGYDQQRQLCRLVKAERNLVINPKTDETVSDQQRVVRSAFAALLPVQQQMIELAYFSGLRQNEIAARLDLSLQSVQTGMRSGMMKLRELLDRFRSHDPKLGHLFMAGLVIIIFLHL